MAEVVPVNSEINRELMPESLRNSVYYVANDESVQLEMAVKEEIANMNKDVYVWEAKMAKLYAEGKSVQTIAKMTRRSQRSIKESLNSLRVQQIIHAWQHLDLLQDGPNELLRRQMLWRIAVDNEKMNPKESTKALAELNKMAGVNQGHGNGGPTINLVISSDVLKRGALDE
jgi:hypothetical protein